MILSHKHRFVFIKGLKVAGTSIEIALAQLCGPEDIITPITPADERYRLGTAGEPRNYADDRKIEKAYLAAVRSGSPAELGSIRQPKTPFTNHMPLTEVLSRVPEAVGYQLIFAERSPYAKVMSFANWEQHQHSYNRGERLARSAEHIAQAVDSIIANGRIRQLRNIERYRDLDGKIRAEPWRYEALGDHVRAFYARCGEAAVEIVHAKEGFRSDSVDVRAALRPDQISLVNELFSDEFEAFGYPRSAPLSDPKI
ncbi:MAG TPA: hypothetical protein VFW39_10990 [Sphingomicrobium sp.]|nr:hypothetical protein [Sphingomicrobium sp.]